jgi:hypothetical protein
MLLAVAHVPLESQTRQNLELVAYVCAGEATMAPPPINTRDIDSPLLQPKDFVPTPPSSFVISQTVFVF